MNKFFNNLFLIKKPVRLVVTLVCKNTNDIIVQEYNPSVFNCSKTAILLCYDIANIIEFFE